jgi:uncharacterized protein YndB with AHSA1/START domain
MRKFLTALAILVAILAVVVGILLAVASNRPDEFSVTRSATMAAPPAAVFEQVNDFHKWEAWSPWAKRDPNAKITFGGPPSGAGATFAWAGNSEVGEGKQAITESRPPELVRLKLEFIKPFPGTSDVEFTFKPEGSGTLVTWSMSGKNNLIGKAMSLFIDCDKMIGGDFEKGLSSMKAVVEAAPKG